MQPNHKMVVTVPAVGKTPVHGIVFTPQTAGLLTALCRGIAGPSSLPISRHAALGIGLPSTRE